MSTTLAALRQALAREHVLYEGFVQLLEAEQRALIKGDTAVIAAAVPGKQAAAEALAAAERARREALVAHATAAGLGLEGLTLTRVLAAAGEHPEAQALRALQPALKAKAQRAAALNGENGELMRTAQAWLDFSLEVLANALRPLRYGAAEVGGGGGAMLDFRG